MKFDNILINGPKEAKNILLLAHGAGAPMDSIFMNTISDGLNNKGIITFRFEFPYMEKRRSGKNTFPDKLDVLCDFYKKIYFNIKKTNPDKNIWLGGKSMGGRVSTLIPFVRTQFFNTALIALVICFVSSLSRAITRTFSSLTKNGLYLILFPVEGNSNSYVGVAIFGKGIISYRNFSVFYLAGLLSSWIIRVQFK